VHQLNFKRLLVAISCAFASLVILPQASEAAGLGKLRVSSGLGEPLSAEIDVLSASAAELDSLEAKIASESVYESQGIERPSLYNAIRVEVKKKTGGAVLKLSSTEPITEPFLDMLIQMDWGSGQILREYNLLLDPPGYDKQKNVEAPTVKANKDEAVTDKPSDVSPLAEAEATKKNKKSGKKVAKNSVTEKSTPEKLAAEKPSDAKVTEKPALATDTNTEGYTTKAGDSLSHIAKKSLQDGVNLDQYMVAMYRANQDAFVRQNMNRLKVGQIVKMPSAEEAAAIAPTEAKKEVVLHSKDWNNYKNSLADQVARAPAQAEADQSANQATTGKIITKAEDKSAPQPIGPRDVVKLSKSDGTNASSTQAQINALQDEIASRDSAVKEANARAAMLEKRIADMEKLLTLKNQGMADAQKNAAVQEEKQPPEAKNAAEAQKPAEPAKPQEAAKPTETKPTGTAASEPTSEPQYTAVVTQPAQNQNVKEAKPAEAKPVEAAPSAGLFDGLLADPLTLGGAAGGLALLGGGWLYLRNKRKRGLDSLEKAIQTSGGLKENTVFGNTEGASIGSGTTSFLTDFSQSGGGMIDTHDVDPIAEAEVYMAYGRDAQAEEILKDAIAKDPKRSELHLKLLELYAGRKDTRAFETVAGELYSTVGNNDPVWAKAAMLGRSLDPNNPLYQVAEGVEASSFVDETAQHEEVEYSANPAMGEGLMDADFSGDEATEITLGGESPEEENGLVEPELEFSLDSNQSASEGKIEFPGLDSLAVPDEQTDHEQQLQDFASIDDAFKEVAVEHGLEEVTAQDASLDFPMLDNQGADSESLEAAPESLGVASVADAESVEDKGFELDFPDFSGMDTDLESLEENTSVDSDKLAVMSAMTEDKLQEISLDMPDVESSSTTGDEADEQAPDLALPEFEMPSFNQSGLGELSEDTVSKSSLAENIAGEVAQVETAMPEVDFSKIDLDLGVEPAPSMQADEANHLADEFDMEAESSEVETKLDLVTAYIDMGDREGAKELLDEVLKEGGPQQRIRAQDMIKSLAA
jgi:pilus assembly protein FimV